MRKPDQIVKEYIEFVTTNKRLPRPSITEEKYLQTFYLRHKDEYPELVELHDKYNTRSNWSKPVVNPVEQIIRYKKFCETNKRLPRSIHKTENALRCFYDRNWEKYPELKEIHDRYAQR